MIILGFGHGTGVKTPAVAKTGVGSVIVRRSQYYGFAALSITENFKPLIPHGLSSIMVAQVKAAVKKRQREAQVFLAPCNLTEAQNILFLVQCICHSGTALQSHF